jgi:hypothetical protein
MKNLDRLTQLTPASLHQVRTELADAIAALRQDVGERLPPLDELDPASPDFASVVGTINENVLTLEVLVKAATDIEKLESAAAKIIQRVWTRIEKHRRATGMPTAATTAS